MSSGGNFANLVHIPPHSDGTPQQWTHRHTLFQWFSHGGSLGYEFDCLAGALPTALVSFQYIPYYNIVGSTLFSIIPIYTLLQCSRFHFISIIPT